MNTLSLVSANDDVLQSSTFLEEEDGVRVAALRLTSASAGATVVAGVCLGWGESLTSGDGDGLAQ